LTPVLHKVVKLVAQFIHMIGVHKVLVKIVCECIKIWVCCVIIRVSIAPPREGFASQEICGEFNFVAVTSIFVNGIEVLIDLKNKVNYFAAVECRRLYPFE
jgi:hypothetical protein